MSLQIDTIWGREGLFSSMITKGLDISMGKFGKTVITLDSLALLVI